MCGTIQNKNIQIANIFLVNKNCLFGKELMNVNSDFGELLELNSLKYFIIKISLY